jgi:histidyl-tRNA synthetase
MDAITKRDVGKVSGFEDWSPEEAIALERMLATISEQYHLAGFTPIRTPLVERPDILLAKAEGQITQQIYGLRLLNPASDSPTDEKDLAVRFDHTVPLVRYVAAKHGNLLFPFRRSVIGPVIRGERPKDGRYREFIQADIDVIGDGQLSFDHDAEMIAVLASVYDKLAFGDFTIRVNNRKILTGFLAAVGCDSPDKVDAARDIIDAVEKTGTSETLRALVKLGISESDAQHSLDLLTKSYSTEDAFALLRTRDFGQEFAEGVEELSQVVETVKALGVPANRYRVDLSVARALDYYTSTVYEARFDQHPHLGSIGGGGRFDNLGEKISLRKFPGVGVSIGVDRLLRRLIKAGIVDTKKKSTASVLIASRDYATERDLHLRRGQQLRANGIPTETYLQKRSLGAQIGFAAKRGITLVVFTHQDEGAAIEQVVVRNVEVGKQVVVHESELVDAVRKML